MRALQWKIQGPDSKALSILFLPPLMHEKAKQFLDSVLLLLLKLLEGIMTQLTCYLSGCKIWKDRIHKNLRRKLFLLILMILSSSMLFPRSWVRRSLKVKRKRNTSFRFQCREQFHLEKRVRKSTALEQKIPSKRRRLEVWLQKKRNQKNMFKFYLNWNGKWTKLSNFWKGRISLSSN